MTSALWGDAWGPNYELWSDVFYAVAQWLCQLHAHVAPGPEHQHIGNPATDNDPCDSCYNEACAIVNDGFLKLLEVYGYVAYMCGRVGVPEREAARRALLEAAERASQIERVKELLAQVAGKAGWWRSPLEYDERQLPEDGDNMCEGLW